MENDSKLLYSNDERVTALMKELEIEKEKRKQVEIELAYKKQEELSKRELLLETTENLEGC